MSYKIIEQYLTPNPYSRPQTKIKKILGIVVHWVANPMSTAKNNRDYFESLRTKKSLYASAHEIIDLNGDIIICIPKDEMAYHVGTNRPYKAGATQIYTPAAWERLNTNSSKKIQPYPNNCTYGIECTHVDWTGKMTDATYNTLVERCADLCIEFKLDPILDLWTHQEVVGWKDCHRWFVNNPNEWKKFKEKVKKTMEQKLNKEEEEKLVKQLQQQVNQYQQQIKQLEKRIADLEKRQKMESIPDWAKQAVENAVQKGLIDTPNNGSYDFYRLVTILDRAGLLK